MRIKVGSPEMRTRKPGLTELQNVRHERPIPTEYGGLYLRSADGTREAITSAERANDPGDLLFSGYASTFNDEYEVYGGPENGWGWYEKIDRGAFQTTMQQKPDVMFLINHTDMPLARTKSGTLRLRVDDHGLFSEADLEKSDPDVQRLVPKMMRKDMDEMSFAFRVVRDRWEAHPDFPDDPMSLRVIEEVSLQKGDVSIVNYGANPFTAGAKIDVVQAAQFLAHADPADMRALSDEDRALAARAIAKISPTLVRSDAAEAVAVIEWPDGDEVKRQELRSPTTDELAQGLHDMAVEMGAECADVQQQDSNDDPDDEERTTGLDAIPGIDASKILIGGPFTQLGAAPGDAAGGVGEGAAGDAAAAAAADGGTAGDAQPASVPGIPDGAPDTTAEPGEHEAPVQTPQDVPPSEPTPEQERSLPETVYEAQRQAVLERNQRREAAEQAAADEVAALHRDEPTPEQEDEEREDPPLNQDAYDEALRNMQAVAQRHEAEAAARLAAERAARAERAAQIEAERGQQQDDPDAPPIIETAYEEGRQAVNEARREAEAAAERAAQAERAAAVEVAEMQRTAEPEPEPERQTDPEVIQSAYDEARVALQERSRQRAAAAEAAQVELDRMRERGEPVAAPEADTRQQQEPPPPLIQTAYEEARTDLRVRAIHTVEEAQRETSGRPPGVPSIKDLIELHERDAAKVTELNREAYEQTRRALLGEAS